MNSPTLPDAIAQPPSRPRRWPRIVMVGAFILLMPIAWYAYSLVAARNAWADAEAETDRLDPHWRFADLEAERKTVPDADNSALHIIAVWRTGGVFGVMNAPTYDATFKASLPPTTQLNAQQTALIRGELGKIANRLQEARRLKDMPYGRFPIKDISDFMGPNHSPRLMSVRFIVHDWLQHDAWLLAQDHEIDLALESCQAGIMASRATTGEPFLVSHVIRIVTRETSIAPLERALAQGETSEERLRAAQKLLEDETKADGWLRAVRGERAGTHHFFEHLRDAKVQPNSLRDTCLWLAKEKDPESVSEWLVKVAPSTSLNHYPGYLRFMNQYVEIGKLPIHERGPALLELEAEHKQSRNPLIRMTVSKFVSVHNSECLNEAQLRAAVVALACERYRLKHHAWPATLGVLVTAKLIEAIPIDPFDAQPLRYRQKADGIVVYSVGLDRTDNQGYFDNSIEDFNVFGPGADIGFRLWSVPQRRQPAPAVNGNGR